jgi:uncharacterized protein YjbJ (UPF0337 family)
MVNQQTLSGNWNELKGKLTRKWATLSDDDLRAFNGNVDQLVGRIQQKTGESREAIEEFLDQVAEEGSQFVGGARDKIEQTAADAVKGAREGYAAFRQGYAEAEKVVQQRPGQAIAVAFGLGLISGLGIALLLHDRNHESRLAHGRDSAEHFGRQMLNALAGMVPDSLAKRSHD